MKQVSAKIVAAVLMAGVMLAPIAGQASEPANNNSPWSFDTFGFHNDLSLYASNKPVGQGNAWIGFDGITAFNDVDYHFMTCQGRVVKSVGINSFSGDLDIQVYDQAGNALGSSAGTGSTETVNIASLNKPGVYMRVYGFNGSQSAQYGVFVNC
jgi:hypothetical protein